MAATHCQSCGAELAAVPAEPATLRRRLALLAKALAGLKLGDWLHLFSFAGVAIAAIVAGTLNWYVLYPHAVLRVTTLSCSNDKIVAAISNIGSRTAYIKGGKAQFFVNDASYSQPVDLTLGKAATLKSAQSDAFEFAIAQPPTTPATRREQRASSVSYAFKWVEAGSSGVRVEGVCRNVSWSAS
jgi:hypothetical protein